MNFTITINESDYTVATSDAAKLTAVTALRIAFNEGKQEDDQLATDDAYLSKVLGDWAVSNPDFTEEDLQATFDRASDSWVGNVSSHEVLEEEMTEEQRKTALRAYAIDKRWRVEVGGITIGGVPVPTSDRAKLLLLGAAECMADGSTSKLVIDGVDYGTYSKAQFVALNAAVIAHVQGTFPILADVVAEINAGTITTTAEIDAYAWLPA